jgi:hypothetical protein
MEICIYDAILSFRLAIRLKCEHTVLICVTLATKVTINPVRQKANSAIYIRPIWCLSTPILCQ